MDLLRSIGDFAWGVLKRFYFYLPAVLLDPWDIYNSYIRTRLFGPDADEIQMPSALFPYALVLGLLLASFFTYRELQVGVGRKRKILKKLKAFYLEGDKYIRAKVFNDEEFEAYTAEMFEWSNSVSEWIMENMGETASSRFRETGNIMPFSHGNDYNRKHMGYINFVAKLRRNLTTLIESGEWDKDD